MHGQRVGLQPPAEDATNLWVLSGFAHGFYV
ncbi:hypothetical protein KW822_13570 [Aeromonas sp. sia0103]|nr:hypothetical protein [Aeromonas sp. sia0103]